MDPQAAKLSGAGIAMCGMIGANEFSGLGIHGLSPVSLGCLGWKELVAAQWPSPRLTTSLR